MLRQIAHQGVVFIICKLHPLANHFAEDLCPLFGLARFGDNDIYAMASAT